MKKIILTASRQHKSVMSNSFKGAKNETLNGIEGGNVIISYAADFFKLIFEFCRECFFAISLYIKTAAFSRTVLRKCTNEQIARHASFCRGYIFCNLVACCQEVKGGTIMPKIKIRVR